jgi:AcrR family transcriptional regulator
MPDNKREKILCAAEREFKLYGYKKTSVVQIAEKAGVSIGTLYAYFQNKAQLFDSIGRPELKEFNPDDEMQKDAILKVALQSFAEKGYAATTMETIATACGFSKVVLYRFFKNKEDLFSEIFYHSVFHQELELPSFPVTKEGLHQFLVTVGTHFMKAFGDPSRLNLMRIVLSHHQSLPQAGKIMYENTVEKVSDALAGCLGVYAERHIIKCADLRLAARSFFGMLYSFILTDYILNPSAQRYNIEAITDFTAALFEKGLKYNDGNDEK